ncbi:hypothetical protein [Ferrimonas lipolytica]|uniref:SnoaL-like domain-containing protein n=1 Tax=Ferrimonas lipolytica TaxID=2724191 RepID=A0A6H1UH60_9GAMM|nr:hypothetical protein [Ferrimonas lipolytica]QIZ78158.1 hypothetical protein HER31_15370 [Ferrimonas lipolytica]
MTTQTLISTVTKTLLSTGALAMALYSTSTFAQANTLSIKEKAEAIVTSIETRDSAAIKHINRRQFIQHNPAIEDGLVGFGTTWHMLPADTTKASVTRVIQDDDFVITHGEYNYLGPKVGFEVFRFEEGKAVEHWDNFQKRQGNNASGRSQTDGIAAITDLDKTDANKALVSDFVTTVLIGRDVDNINQFIGTAAADYLQHNPSMADGAVAVIAAVTADGTAPSYQTNHKILGEGNFVLAISEGSFNSKPVAIYDLFRLDNGMIVEHWDTVEVIPATSKWANDNGKFGFN